MKARNLFKNDDRGVSPVIGVILMVAITVILAAVIGTFVLGLGNSVQSEVSAGVSITGSDSASERTVTYTSEGTSTRIYVNGTAGTTNTPTGSPLENVGDSVSVSTSGNYSVIAANEDGQRTVIRTFEVA